MEPFTSIIIQLADVNYYGEITMSVNAGSINIYINEEIVMKIYGKFRAPTPDLEVIVQGKKLFN